MPEDLSSLSQKQLKGRKVVATNYKSSLENEVTKITKYLDNIDVELNTNPSLPSKPYSTWTRPQLEELQIVLNKALMRSSALATDYKTELKQIDEAIMNL